MRKWIEYKVGELCLTIYSGGTPSTAHPEYWNGEYNWLSSGETSNRYITKTEKTITKEGIDSSSTKLAKTGTLVMASAGQGKTRGQASILKCDTYINQSIIALVGKLELLDTTFLFYNMMLRYEELRARSDASSTRGSITTDMLKKLPILLPDLATQKYIADILSTYDDLIEANNRRIELLEQAGQELYNEWFVRFRFPGHEKAKFENDLPEGWNIQRLYTYGRIETGKTPSMEKQENYGNDVMFIKTPDMHGNTFVIKSEEMLSECGHLTQPKKLLPPNSIMVTCIGSGGIVAINAEQAHTNQQINSIVLNDSKKLEWLYFTCKSLKPAIELFGATGTTMTNLSKGKFERLKVINPDDALILQYHKFVAPMFDKIKSLMYQNQNLAAQRDLLLPRLMSGKLEV